MLAYVTKGFSAIQTGFCLEMHGRCVKVNDTAGALLNRETTGKRFEEHSNSLRGTCYGIPKVLGCCNSSVIAKQKDSGKKLELVNCLIVDLTRTLQCLVVTQVIQRKLVTWPSYICS